MISKFQSMATPFLPVGTINLQIPTVLCYIHPLTILTMSKLPFSQFLGLRRLCSDDSDFSNKSEEMYQLLKKRGYPDSVVTRLNTVLNRSIDSQHSKRHRRKRTRGALRDDPKNGYVGVSKRFNTKCLGYLTSDERLDVTSASHTNRDSFQTYTISCTRNIIRYYLELRNFALIPCPHAQTFNYDRKLLSF